MHIGSKKLSASQGVLYGMMEYAAKSPNAQNAVNIAKRCLALSRATRDPSDDRISTADSTFIPHFKKAQLVFCVCSLLPVLAQMVYASNAFLTPSAYVKNDVKKTTPTYIKMVT